MKFFKIIFFVVFVQTLTAQPLTVGVVTSLTGIASDYGQAIKNGIQLATLRSPEKFTHIKFIFEDAAFSPAAAMVSYKKLSQIDKANMILTWGVSFCKALAPVAESDRIPLVGICMDPSMGTGREYVVRFKNSTDEIMKTQLESLSRQNKNRIGLILSEHPYLSELAQALRRNLRQDQSLKIIKDISSSESDFRSMLLSINPSEFDSIGVFLFGNQIPTFYKQAKDLKINLPTFGTDFFESQSLVEASGDAMEGKTFAALSVDEKFTQLYKSQYHTVSQLSFAAAAHEFAQLVGELFNESSSLRGKELINTLSRVSNRKGSATDMYSFKEDVLNGKYFQFPIAMKEIVGTEFKNVSN